jgi:hypothetical protein
MKKWFCEACRRDWYVGVCPLCHRDLAALERLEEIRLTRASPTGPGEHVGGGTAYWCGPGVVHGSWRGEGRS